LANLFGVELWERLSFYGLQGSVVLVMFGHIALALLPGLPGAGVGLVLIALGSGGVRANATSLVGAVYTEGDERRGAGFSLFIWASTSVRCSDRY
jgi:POT family proton-dependent oligopeptide transporter